MLRIIQELAETVLSVRLIVGRVPLTAKRRKVQLVLFSRHMMEVSAPTVCVRVRVCSLKGTTYFVENLANTCDLCTSDVWSRRRRRVTTIVSFKNN